MDSNMFCQEHQKPFKGPNARGNYWHLINFETKEFCNKPASEVTDAPYTPNMAKTSQDIRETIEDKPDWEEIALGKIRHGVAIAYIEKGSVLTDRIKEEILAWTDFIKSGK